MQSGADTLVSELGRTRELARKLGENLDPAQIEMCRALAGEIICSIEKAISTAKTSSAGAAELVLSNVVGGLHVERFSQDISDKEQKISRRRKILANRTGQVSVTTEAGAEVPPDDGHSWRKYGQKDILGAKHPRSYYRCTYRKTQGCPAMKQVQKSDENPSVFDITYLGTHTCFNVPQQTATTTRSQNPQQRLLDQQNSLVLQLDFQTSLIEVSTESSDTENRNPISPFSFSSTPMEGMNPENALFCSSPRVENGYGGILSSALMSPTSYGSNSFLWPSCQISNQEDSGLTEIFSAANSVTDSPVMDVDSMLEFEEMDTDILFDTSIFLL